MPGKWLKSYYAVSSGVMLLMERRNKSYDHAPEAEIEKLQKITGKQVIEMEVLKKWTNCFRKDRCSKGS